MRMHPKRAVLVLAPPSSDLQWRNNHPDEGYVCAHAGLLKDHPRLQQALSARSLAGYPPDVQAFVSQSASWEYKANRGRDRPVGLRPVTNHSYQQLQERSVAVTREAAEAALEAPPLSGPSLRAEFRFVTWTTNASADGRRLQRVRAG